MDAVSTDGQFALTLIAFIGSVFSPYYAWSGRGAPENHCAVNVALYGRPGARWAMTERKKSALSRSAASLTIGGSNLTWDEGVLTITLDEIGFPLPKAVRGTIRVTPSAFTEQAYALDAAERHLWHPIAPRAHVALDLSRPNLSWSGAGYLDSNRGLESLEDGFKDWTWCRAHRAEDSLIMYETRFRQGGHGTLGLCIGEDGAVTHVDPPPTTQLPGTLWGIPRDAHTDANSTASVHKTFEDTPFYARSEISAHMLGEKTLAVHESLSLDRFRTSWVRALLPFRMPRRFF